MRIVCSLPLTFSQSEFQTQCVCMYWVSVSHIYVTIDPLRFNLGLNDPLINVFDNH